MHPRDVLGLTGVNVSPNGADDVGLLADTGIEFIRLAVKVADQGPPYVRHDLRDYLRRARAIGLRVLLVFDRDAYYWPDWRHRTAEYVAHWLEYYAGLFDAVQVGNEPDHESPYSWTMPAGEFGDLLRATHDAVRGHRGATDGSGVYLIAGGLVSGDSSYLDHGLRDVLPWYVNSYACHPYAKDAPNPHDTEDWQDADALFREYDARLPDLPCLISEWGFPGYPGVEGRQAEEVGDFVAWCRELGRPLGYFRHTDWGESLFGLWREDGSPKPAVDALVRAVARVPAPIPAPAPPVVVEPEPIPEPTPEPEPIPVPDQPWTPRVDPWEWWTLERLAAATRCPLDAVREHWPIVADGLAACGIWERNVAVSVAGTVAHETASTFRPIHEYGTPADWAHYSGGSRYAGRGYLQVTHDYNYRAYGRQLAELWGGTIAPTALVDDPDLALDPWVSAALLALYWRDRRTLPTAAWPAGYSLLDASRRREHEWVRILVLGGTDGVERLVEVAAALGADVPVPAPAAPVAERVSFDPWADVAERQNLSYDCSQETLENILEAFGRSPSDAWLERTMIAEGVMAPNLGLLDARGAGLAAFVNRHYGELGYRATWDGDVSFDDVAAAADGTRGVGIGGRAWGHWSWCRNYDGDADVLRLGNSAPGHQGIYQEMTRGQFAALGPFSMVVVEHEGGGAGAEEEEDEMIWRPKAEALIGAVAYLGDDVADALETERAALDDFGPAPRMPKAPGKMLKADWKSYADALEDWRDRVQENVNARYDGVGALGQRLRDVRTEFVGPRSAA